MARAAGLPIILAGEPHEVRDEEFFEARVRPVFDGEQVRWAGPVDDAAKNDLRRHAAALLFPIQWDEPFGIVMIEAMACGAPALACSHGSVPEVVDVGITGYHADSPEELAALLPAARGMERSQVRSHARRRFSRQAMTESYLKIYESVAESRPVN
ncbi:MAG: glycosyltransferase family 4 protein [Acidobacteria bacterium]|nr:glycosyltransferase family 4 protein [Acidobacteriota bacterium]